MNKIETIDMNDDGSDEQIFFVMIQPNSPRDVVESSLRDLCDWCSKHNSLGHELVVTARHSELKFDCD